MTPPQITRLAIAIVLSLLWIGLGQDWLFQNLLVDLFAAPNVAMRTLFQDAVNPAFQTLWVACITGTLAWLWITYKTRPSSVEDVLKIGKKWWWIAMTNFLVGWCLLPLFLRDYPIPAPAWLTLLIFVLIDVSICFWLPTLMATPRTFRLVVPGAVKFFGDR